MNTKKLVWCCAAVALLMLSGCKPVYEKRIQGTWKVDTYLYNNVDDTADFLILQEDYTITFYENNDFVEEYNALKLLPVTNTGTWVIEKKPNGKIGEYQLRLTDDGVRIFDIKKISKDEIDIYREIGDGNNQEFSLEPVPE
jgi:hypothetical protein